MIRYYKLLPNLSARWNGWRDRRKNYPNQNTEVIELRNVNFNQEEDLVECAAQYEVRVCNLAHRMIDKIYQQWESRDGKLAAKHKNARHKLKIRKENRTKAKNKYEKLAEQVAGDPTQHHLPRWGYWILIFILGVAEFAMNMQVFTVFGAPQYETLLMALILSFAFPVSGHYFGRVLRERPVSIPLLAVTAFCGLVVVFAVYYMSRLRSVFFTLTAEVGGSELVHYSWMFFLFLNLLVLVISTLASYYVHEVDEKNARRRRALEKARKDYATAEKKYHAALDMVTHIAAERQHLLGYYQREADAVANRGQELISIYRTANSRRKTPLPPHIFKSHPDIKVPRFTPRQYDWEKDSPPPSLNNASGGVGGNFPGASPFQNPGDQPPSSSAKPEESL